MTKNAQYILEIISHSDCHLTAEQIYHHLKESNKTVVPATVYNNLAHLYRQGLIRKISVAGYPDRYDKLRRHDHLVCKCCGKLSDIFLDDFTAQIQSQLGVPMLSYELQINYLCEECSEKENGDNES